MTEALNVYKKIFPGDTTTAKTIDEYLLYRQVGNVRQIRVGIRYSSPEVARRSRIIDAVLAEPLATGNGQWLAEIAARDRTRNARFTYRQESEIDRSSNTFAIPASMLAAAYRPLFADALGPPEASHDIELVELNQEDEPCTLELFVADAVTTPSATGSALVVDNSDYTRPSRVAAPPAFDRHSRSQNIIKLDSQLYMAAVGAFLEHDTGATDTFINGLQNSNIYELQKYLAWNLRLEVVLRLLESQLLARILANKPELPDSEADKLITEFRANAHLELQRHFEPATAAFFRRKLPWWKLYVKNDNVEYELKDFFMRNFMNRSIETYGYTRGQLVTALEAPNSTFENPLYTLRQSVIDDRIATEIQSRVYTMLTQGLLFYQVPVSALAFAAYWHFDFSANSALALASLGWVVGFNHVSLQWTRLSKKWRQALFNDIRQCIEGPCQQQLQAEVVTQTAQQDVRNHARSAAVASLLREQ